MGTSWSHEFAVLSNKKFICLKVVMHQILQIYFCTKTQKLELKFSFSHKTKTENKVLVTKFTKLNSVCCSG